MNPNTLIPNFPGDSKGLWCAKCGSAGFGEVFTSTGELVGVFCAACFIARHQAARHQAQAPVPVNTCKLGRIDIEAMTSSVSPAVANPSVGGRDILTLTSEEAARHQFVVPPPVDLVAHLASLEARIVALESATFPVQMPAGIVAAMEHLEDELGGPNEHRDETFTISMIPYNQEGAQ